MNRPLRVVSLNLRAYPNPRANQIEDLATLIAGHQPDIVLVQECMRPWLDVICRTAGLTGVHSHDVAPEVPHSEFPPDGTAIAVRPPIQIERGWRLDPALFETEAVRAEIEEDTPAGFETLRRRIAYRFSARALLAELMAGERRFVVGSFHATPGVSIGEWKPFFHGGVALALSRLELPFIFAIDANEPMAETTETVTFHWADGRPGALKLQALLGLEPRHRARDLLRESLRRNGTNPVTEEILSLTYTTTGGGQRRFDSIWATPEFALGDLHTYYEEALAAGTDHALISADLVL